MVKKSKAKEEEVDDDVLGLGGSDDDAVSGISGCSSDDEDDAALDDGEGMEEEEEGACSQEDEDEEGDEERRTPEAVSRTLALLSKGEQASDMSTIKQQIHDDSTLLGNWRKSKELGERRTRSEVFARLVSNCSTYFGYSEELAEYFLQMFSPEAAIKFFEANEQQRPLTIRTNSLKARRSTLMQSLSARKVVSEPIGEWTKVGLKVYESAVPVGATPEYLGGHYMIQSASSFVPVMALAPQQNEVVLDMAAAPGGKTTYIGQLMRNTGTLFANDLRKERCKSLVANTHRMGLTNVIVMNSDGRKLKDMLPRLDRVLLDAPCTGAGIIARDPSVKVKRGSKDFDEASSLQKELLMHAIDMVDANSKSGGYIVYSTCSVSVEENEAVVEHALKVRNVELVSFESAVNFGVEGLTKYRECRFHQSMNLCRRYYPHVHNMDGFFVAKFKKTSNAIPERTKKDRSKGSENIKVWGEEHWTPDMMDKIASFEEPGAEVAVAAKPKNKIERKKLKRQQQLAARQQAASVSAASSASAPEASAKPVAKAAEEEPRPLKKLKSARLAKEKELSSVIAAAPTPATPPSKKKVVKKKIKKQKQAAVSSERSEAEQRKEVKVVNEKVSKEKKKIKKKNKSAAT